MANNWYLVLFRIKKSYCTNIVLWSYAHMNHLFKWTKPNPMQSVLTCINNDTYWPITQPTQHNDLATSWKSSWKHGMWCHLLGPKREGLLFRYSQGTHYNHQLQKHQVLMAPLTTRQSQPYKHTMLFQVFEQITDILNVHIRLHMQ